MPCYSTQTMSVEFHAKNRKLLDEALGALGWQAQEVSPGVLRVAGQGITLRLSEGRAEVREGRQTQLNQLKQQYSREALDRVARLRGWRLKTSLKTSKLTQGVLRR